jgi:hypothetical protein
MERLEKGFYTAHFKHEDRPYLVFVSERYMIWVWVGKDGKVTINSDYSMDEDQSWVFDDYWKLTKVESL